MWTGMGDKGLHMSLLFPVAPPLWLSAVITLSPMVCFFQSALGMKTTLSQYTVDTLGLQGALLAEK